MPEPLAFLRRETAAGPESWLVMRRLPGEPMRVVPLVTLSPAHLASVRRYVGQQEQLALAGRHQDGHTLTPR